MDINTLNNRQKEALLHTKGPLLILAGAGSGKTKVVTSKIAYLIEEKNVPSWKILAITFTNKAAKEMKDRVNKLIDEDVDSLWIGTFHSICVRILRRNIDKIGFDKKFTIYDTQDQQTVIRDAIKFLNLNKDLYKPRSIISKISELKNEGYTPDEFINENETDIYLYTIGRIYREYENSLISNNALDFDDLIIKTVQLLRDNKEIRNFYQDKFEYIFVDEYQDTNKIQYELIKYLSKDNPNLTVVGDNDQSIYKWRGADISNILNFEDDYKNAKIIKLEQNYRSTQKILDVANSVIKNNASKLKKNLWTNKVGGNSVKYKEFSHSNEEEYGVVQKIYQLKYKDIDFKNMAILYRTNAQSRGFEEALIKEGIPYKLVGGLRFYDRAEVKDILAYLKVINNPEDNVSLIRIINRPKRGIGDTTVNEMLEFAKDNGISLFDVIINFEELGLKLRAKKNLKTFSDIINLLIKKSEELSVGKLMEEVIYETAYIEELEKDGSVEARSRIENIKELLNSTYEYDKDNILLEEYLSTMSLLSDIDKTSSEDGVNLMTIHAAKGLEFNTVFLVGMEEGLFPNARSLESDEDIEEERRLCYVAVTRAEENLFISSARSRYSYGKSTPQLKSRFIDEMKDYIEIEEKKENLNIIDKREKSIDISKKFFEDKKKATPKNDINSLDVNIGDKVKHKKFGIGMVVSKTSKNNDYELVISFDGKGLKKLMLSLAPIEVVK